MMNEQQVYKRGMKVKTINAILTKKFDDFVESIDNPTVKELVKNNTIITGGSIASMLLGEKVNDFDMYFTNFETTKAVAEYYLDKFNARRQAATGIPTKVYVYIEDQGSETQYVDGIPVVKDLPKRIMAVVKSAGVASEDDSDSKYEYFEMNPNDEAAGQYVGEVLGDSGEIEEKYQETEQLALENEDCDYRPVFISTNAITLTGKVQLILRFYGNAEELHKNYDFVHCTNYWESKTKKVTLRQDALESLLSRELRYVGSRYPVCSIIRLRKFIKRGWTVNAGQILKMMLQVNELNLKDLRVLRDQLTGVDSAYFCQLLSQVKNDNPDKLDSAYVCEIIDRIF